MADIIIYTVPEIHLSHMIPENGVYTHDIRRLLRRIFCRVPDIYAGMILMYKT